MHIGQKIKQLVESKKMTPIEFAQLLGKKSRASAYDVWDREDINTKDLKIIASHFEVEMSYFFETKTKSKSKTESNSANSDELKSYLMDQVREKDLRIIELEKELDALKRKKAHCHVTAEE